MKFFCRLNNTAIAKLAVKLNHLMNNGIGSIFFFTLALCITDVHIPLFFWGTFLEQALFFKDFTMQVNHILPT